VILAINLLREDKLLAVQDADDEPQYLQIMMGAIRKVKADTWIKKGYSFVKEVRQWF